MAPMRIWTAVLQASLLRSIQGETSQERQEEAGDDSQQSEH